MRLLVLNAGSSSLKFEVCDAEAPDGGEGQDDAGRNVTGARVVSLLAGTYADFGPGGCSLEWRRAGGDDAARGERVAKVLRPGTTLPTGDGDAMDTTEPP